MDEQKEDQMYQILVDKVFERCQEVQLENERLVYRTNKVKKLVQRCGRDIELLKRRLDRHNDNWRSLPMVLPHPKRKIEQKRGPKPKSKQDTPNSQTNDSTKLISNSETGKKVRKQRMRKADKEALNQQDATLLRQQQQQKRQELQKQRQREQQALKQAAQQQRQLLRQQKQMAAQHLKQQRQLQRQLQRANNQQKKTTTNSTTNVGSVSPQNNSLNGKFVTKVSTTFLTPQRSTNQGGGDVIMPPPPPPPKVDAHYTEQQAQLILMHRSIQSTKN